MPTITPTSIQTALDSERWETARRLAALSLEANPSQLDVRLMQHRTYRKLGDLWTARDCLKAHPVEADGERLTIELLLAEDHYIVGGHDYYRLSSEAVEGLSPDEYADKYTTLAGDALQKITSLAKTLGREDELEAMKRRIGISRYIYDPRKPPECTLPDEGVAALRGSLSMADGSPAAGVKMIMGLQVPMDEPHPSTYMRHDLDYDVAIGKRLSGDRP